MVDLLFFLGGLGYTLVAMPALLKRDRLPRSLCLGVLGMDVLYLVGYVLLGLTASSLITGLHLVVWLGLLGRSR